MRPHRLAAKVLEITIALTEERIKQMGDQEAELEWQLEYLKTLDPRNRTGRRRLKFYI